MFALAAVVLFAIALILHLLSARPDIAADLIIGGFLAIALHLAFAIGMPGRHSA